MMGDGGASAVGVLSAVVAGMIKSRTREHGVEQKDDRMIECF